jgi:hypothetical protein
MSSRPINSLLCYLEQTPQVHAVSILSHVPLYVRSVYCEYFVGHGDNCYCCMQISNISEQGVSALALSANIYADV